MESNYRSQIFKLCKIIDEKDFSKRIRSILFDFSKPININDASASPSNDRSLFAQIARGNNSDFLGYLLLDDSIISKDLPIKIDVLGLSDDESMVFNAGHRTIMRFIELCLEEISHKSTKLAKMIHPYNLYKSANIDMNVSSVISDEEFKPVVDEFKKTSIYKKILSTNYDGLINIVNEEELYKLIYLTNKEIDISLVKSPTDTIQKISDNLRVNNINPQEFLTLYVIMICTLRNILSLSCKVLFNSFCGDNLLVLNNDNIISIKNSCTNCLCKYYSVLSQNMILLNSAEAVNGIVLFDCDLSEQIHMHEFGMVVSYSFNFEKDFGSTSRYSFVLINEEMNCIYLLTDRIVKYDFIELKAEKHL